MQGLITPRALALTLALFLFGATSGAAQPRIELEPEFLAFGDIPENETRLLQVIIRNTGDQVLRIGDIQLTCPCTLPTLQAQEVAPGASTVMEVLFNSRNFQGPQLKYLTIMTNDPRRGIIDYAVTADIKVPLLMTPHQTMVDFATLHQGETSSRTYTFRSEEVELLSIEPQTWPRDWLDIDVQRGENPQQVAIVFTASPAGSAGRYRDTVRLTTNVPASPTVSLEVSARLVADLQLSMERVNLGAVRPGRALQARIQVTAHRPGIAFALTGAEIDIPELHASVVNEQNSYFVVIDGHALAADHPLMQASQGRIQGTLRVFSDLETTPELQVPVTYIIRR